MIIALVLVSNSRGVKPERWLGMQRNINDEGFCNANYGLNKPLSKGILVVSTNSRKLLGQELVLTVFNKELSIEFSIVTVKVVNLSSSLFP